MTGGTKVPEDQALRVLEAERVPYAAVNLPGDLTPPRAHAARHGGAGLDAPAHSQLQAIVQEAGVDGWRAFVAAANLGDAHEGADVWALANGALDTLLRHAGESPHVLVAFPNPEGGGALLAAGPGVHAGARGPENASWEDVAATALTWLEVPVPASMRGAHLEAFEQAPEWDAEEAARVRDHLERSGSL